MTALEEDFSTFFCCIKNWTSVRSIDRRIACVISAIDRGLQRPDGGEQVNLRTTSALCWPQAAESCLLLTTEVQESPKKLSGVAGAQQIDREWLQLKSILFHNLQRKCKKGGDFDVNPRLKLRVYH